MKVRLALSLTVLAALSACANVKDAQPRSCVLWLHPTQRRGLHRLRAGAWKAQGIKFEQKAVRNGFELVQSDSLGVEAVLTTTHWKGKTETRLSTRINRRDQSMIEPANLCL